jgi:hypothetical protein
MVVLMLAKETRSGVHGQVKNTWYPSVNTHLFPHGGSGLVCRIKSTPMKFHLLSLLLLLGRSTSSLGQNSSSTEAITPTHKEHTLSYDHGTGHGLLLNTAPLRLDDNVRVRITNVNRLMYQVKITGNNEVFESQPPQGFMTLLGFQVAREAEASEATGNVSDPSAVQPSAAANDLNATEEKVRKFTEQLQRDALVQQGSKKLNARFQLFPDGATLTTTKTYLEAEASKADSVANANVSMRKELVTLQERVTALRTSIEQGVQDQARYDQALKDLKKRFEEFGRSFEGLERMRSLYNKLVSIAYHEGFDMAETGKLLAGVIMDMPYLNDKDKLVRQYEDSQETMGQTLEEFRYIALQLKKDRSGTE